MTQPERDSRPELTLDDLLPSSAAASPGTSGESDVPPLTSPSEADRALPSETDWHTVAEALYERNRELHTEVAHLQGALADAREQAAAREWRSRQAEDAATRHIEEVNAAHAQNLQLSQDLAEALELIQKQQTLLEECAQQSETANERIASLEATCAEAELAASGALARAESAERTIEELSDRLERQRASTQQFKAALAAAGQLRARPNATALKPQAIQPWSASATATSPNTAASDAIATAAEGATETAVATAAPDATDALDFPASKPGKFSLDLPHFN